MSPTAPTGLPRLIGDGSTSDTGVQPRQPTVSRLVPGQAPPQFVICSWDGAGETGLRLFSHFRGVAEELSASMTFFLTGLYAVPAARRAVYRPPRHPVGASDIGFLPERSVHATIDQVGGAWLEGHEIGTHFNGHFCGPGGVDLWSPEEWDTEIEQAVSFVKTWRTTTGFTDLPPLPFDYDAELIGGRTPCLQGQANLLRAGRATTWRYDSSGTGRQVWPTRFPGGRWNLPMQAIPFPGHDFEVISMDYNMMYNQSKTPDGDPAARAVWRGQARDAYLAGFRRAYHGNRAPLVIGNHFERWNGGIYMEAVEAAIREMAAHPDVRFVSFHQLVDWLEAQDPSVLRALQSLDVGRPPRGGWD
ncbi:MAG: hypothetical protein ACR2JN_07825 [Lapillicoccus sp.]